MNSSANTTVGRSRVLVVKLSSLGDLFHALPSVHLLKKQLNAEVDWVTQPEYAGLVGCFTDVRRVITFPRRRLISGLPEYLRAVRREQYDYIVDFQGLLKSALAARCARGGRRIGPSYQREGACVFYHDTAGPRNKNRHAVDEALDVVRFLDLPVNETVFPVSFPPYALKGAGPRVAFIPCSRWPTKNAPPALFAGVGRLLLQQGVQTIYLAGSPADSAVCRFMEEELKDERVVNVCGRTSLPELGGLLSRMDLVLTVDSGPMHLAAAAGVRVAAFFGATDPGRTGPYGNHHLLITSPETLACRPCFSRTCQRGDMACLNQLTPEYVMERLLEAHAL